MWKILVAFIIFSAIALTVVFKMGDSIDMQGEASGHDMTQSHEQDKPAAQAPAAEAESSTPATTPEADKK
jgi:hypothetical protein